MIICDDPFRFINKIFIFALFFTLCKESTKVSNAVPENSVFFISNPGHLRLFLNFDHHSFHKPSKTLQLSQLQI